MKALTVFFLFALVLNISSVAFAEDTADSSGSQCNNARTVDSVVGEESEDATTEEAGI